MSDIRVSIRPSIGKLSAEDQKKWIADRKKAMPQVDWEAEVAKVTPKAK